MAGARYVPPHPLRGGQTSPFHWFTSSPTTTFATSATIYISPDAWGAVLLALSLVH